MAEFEEIPLTRGEVALVDQSDFGRLSQWDWYCTKPSGSREHKYAARMAEGQEKMVLMHRVIAQPGTDEVVDHINGQGLDNRRENLRVCRHKDNIRAQKPQRGVTSEFRGVSWKADKEKWRAQIRVDGENHHLGYFEDEKKAAEVYNEAASEHFGEYAYENPLP